MEIVKTTKALASVAVVLAVTACGSTDDRNPIDISDIENREARLQQQEADYERRIAALKAQEASGSQTAPTQVASGDELLPPNAKPGQCFTRVWQPATYKTIEEQKLVSEASERIELIPARYGKTQKRVLVQEASSKLVAVPATYKTITERVLVQGGRTETIKVPAVYETVSERVIDKPAHTIWKKGTGPIQRIDETTGEIMCLVEVPATYKTINKRVLKTAATTRTKEYPPVYKTVQKRVVDTPATTKTVDIPAKYAMVDVVEETAPAQEKRIPIPAKYAKVSRRELLTDGHMQWREILCETNTTPERVADIQRALLKAGFNPGPIDGDIGPGTVSAINAFQRSRGLPVDKYLNVQTVKALGVSPR